jgi:hypothetical protein
MVMAGTSLVYIERYRFFRGTVIASVGPAVVALGSPSRIHDAFIWVWVALWLILANTPTMISVLFKQPALRVDEHGIFLGGGGTSGSTFPGRITLIPWGDVAEIILYRGRWGIGRFISIRRPPNVPNLARRPGGRLDKPVKKCPVAGVTIGSSRYVAGWDLDPEKLSAAVMRFSPAVPIKDLWDR